MNHPSETQLALLAGGDLCAEDASAAARHLTECPDCREKVDGFRNAAAWLKSVAAEPDAEQICRLREKVAARSVRRPKWKVFGWLAAATAAVTIAVFMSLPRTRPVHQALPPAVELPPLPAGRAYLGPLVLPRTELKASVNAAAPRLTLMAKSSASSPVIRVKTSDPDVVILWVVGDGSEQEKEQ